MERFSGKTAIVTGSSEGIGLATAEELLLEGARVVINGRDATKLDAVKERLARIAPERVAAVAADVMDPASGDRLAQEALGRFGRIDVLINNVGGGTETRPVEEIDETSWRIELDRNLSSAFWVMRAVIPTMRSQRYGRIVNVSSIAGRQKGRLSGAIYSAAKAGLQGLSRHLAWDLVSFGITVNAVAPGLTWTDRVAARWESRAPEQQQALLATVPMNRFAAPREIARPILFLASDDASYITGVTLDVNGGSFMS